MEGDLTMSKLCGPQLFRKNLFTGEVLPENVTEKKYYTPKGINIDPRQDLVEDTCLWTILLTEARKKSITLAGVLHGLRCGGTRIESGAKGLVIRGGDWEDYGTYRDKYLMPYKDDVKKLLERLNKK